MEADCSSCSRQFEIVLDSSKRSFDTKYAGSNIDGNRLIAPCRPSLRRGGAFFLQKGPGARFSAGKNKTAQPVGHAWVISGN
jgi:hypothetical protein